MSEFRTIVSETDMFEDYVHRVIDKLSPEDVREANAYGVDPDILVLSSLETSALKCVALIDDEPVMLGGFTRPQEDGLVGPWMVHTERDNSMSDMLKIVKQARRLVNLAAADHALSNLVLAANERSLWFLSSAGFRVLPQDVWVGENVFRRFYRGRTH